jgi:hypothetical protein
LVIVNDFTLTFVSSTRNIFVSRFLAAESDVSPLEQFFAFSSSATGLGQDRPSRLYSFEARIIIDFFRHRQTHIEAGEWVFERAHTRPPRDSELIEANGAQVLGDPNSRHVAG